MNEKPKYYAVIPASVRYNENINSSQKIFYSEITALTQKTGECWASNNYFASLYKVSPGSISNWVKKLEKEGLISVEYIKNGKEIEKRIIKLGGIQNIDYVVNKLNRGSQNIEEGYSKFCKENNTSINNTSINKKKYIKKSFKAPTLEEVKDYCLNVRHNKVDYQFFYDYFTEGNWIDSKGNKVKNWKQKIVTWEKRKHREKEDEYENYWKEKLDEEK